MLQKGKWQTTEQEQTTQAGLMQLISHLLSAQSLPSSRQLGRSWRDEFLAWLWIYCSNSSVFFIQTRGMRAKLLSNHMGAKRMAFGGTGFKVG